MSDPFSTVTSELPRDRWGRPLITPPEGGDPVAYQRVTTFVKCLDDTYHLTQWQKRMVALGMASRRDLVLATVAISDPDDRNQKKTLNGIAESAVEAAKGHARATTGTALHSFSERIDRGEPIGDNVPEEYLADLAVYAKIVRYFEIVAIEGFCVVDEYRVGGSYDRILRFTAEGLDLFEREQGHRLAFPDGVEVVPGDTVIGDLKTGKSIDFGIGAIAMQLGTYANAEDYDHTLGSRTPLAGNPRKDWAVVIHLPAGTGRASLVWVDIAAGWETASTVAPLVHAWRKRKDLSYAFAADSAVVSAGPSLVEQIHAATSAEALRALYAMNADKWTPGLTALSKERIAALGG